MSDGKSTQYPLHVCMVCFVKKSYTSFFYLNMFSLTEKTSAISIIIHITHTQQNYRLKACTRNHIKSDQAGLTNGISMYHNFQTKDNSYS